MTDSADPGTRDFPKASTVGQFASDLGLALKAWKNDPWLPITTAVVGAMFAAPQTGGLVLHNSLLSAASWIALLFTLGFYGTQRIWYLRLFRGKRLSPSELWTFSWSFLGRYLVLGLLTGGPWVVGFVGYFLLVRLGPRAFTPVYAGTIAYLLALDFLLTFAAPALAYNTRSAAQALEFGVRMIRRTWPAGALYIFFPPLALQLLVYQPERLVGLSMPILVVGTVITALINLLFKGAVAAFYLRYVHGIGDDGAVHQPHPTASTNAA